MSASISMTSTKLALMIRMSCLNCDSRISTTTMMSDSDAATAGRRSSRSQTKLRRPQVSRKASPGDEVVLGAQQDGERRQMQQHQHADAQTMAFAGQGGQPGTTEKSERGRHVTGAAPGLDTVTAGGGPVSSFCNKRGNARAARRPGAGEWPNKVKAGGLNPPGPARFASPACVGGCVSEAASRARASLSRKREGEASQPLVPGFVHQRPLLDPGHHLAELGADLLDRSARRAWRGSP